MSQEIELSEAGKTARRGYNNLNEVGTSRQIAITRKNWKHKTCSLREIRKNPQVHKRSRTATVAENEKTFVGNASGLL